MQLAVSQALALFVKLIRKITTRLQDIQREAISVALPSVHAMALPTSNDLDNGTKELEAELTEAGKEVTGEMREKQRAMIDALDLSR